MGASLGYFATHHDSTELFEYARSVGLRMYPILMEQPEKLPADDPQSYPFCYLTHLDRSQLHPYGDPPGIGPATDPLITASLGHYQSNRVPPRLVFGWISWSNDVPEFAKITKPYFTKLAKWMRENWRQNEHKQFMGPEAERLLAQGTEIGNNIASDAG